MNMQTENACCQGKFLTSKSGQTFLSVGSFLGQPKYFSPRPKKVKITYTGIEEKRAHDFRKKILLFARFLIKADLINLTYFKAKKCRTPNQLIGDVANGVLEIEEWEFMVATGLL